MRDKLLWAIVTLTIGGVSMIASVKEGFALPGGIAMLVLAAIIGGIIWKRRKSEQPLIKGKIPSLIDGELEDKSPTIRVEPIVYYDNKAKLEVHNDGNDAIFTAKARVIKGCKGCVEPELYNLCWESRPNQACSTIGKGNAESILVAEVSPDTVKTDNPLTPVFKGGIALYKMGKERIGASTLDTVQTYKYKERYPTMFTNKIVPKDECVIEVTITSEPPLKEDFGTQQYSLEVDHTSRDKLIFTNVSNLNKE